MEASPSKVMATVQPAPLPLLPITASRSGPEEPVGVDV